MSSERMQTFLKGVAKTGEFKFEKYFAPLPYEIGTPMHNVCVTFIRDYNNICDQYNAGQMLPKAAAVNIARLHEDTFGGARLDKYKDFTTSFFSHALANTPGNKSLLAQLNRTYRGSDLPLDTHLMADLLVHGVVRATTAPFRIINNIRREATLRENVRILTNVENAALSMSQGGSAVSSRAENILREARGNLPPSPQMLREIGEHIAQINADAPKLHAHMTEAKLAKPRSILSSMKVEAVDQISKTNADLRKAAIDLQAAMDVYPTNTPESAESKRQIQTKLDALNKVFAVDTSQQFLSEGNLRAYGGAETLKAEMRAQSAFVEFQAKNVEEILRLRLETGESLGKSDRIVLARAAEEMQRRMDGLAKLVESNGGAGALHAADTEAMKSLNVRMGRINEMLSSPKAGKEFISDDLKEKLKKAIDPKIIEKISEAVRDALQRIMGPFAPA